jgi:uncharacterized OB-fold protein
MESQPLGYPSTWEGVNVVQLGEITARYFECFAAGKLPYLECPSCGHKFYYPRNRCPKCLSPDIKISLSAGLGTIFSLTWIHGKDPSDRKSYAIISLNEGFKLYSSLIESDHADIDDRVQVVMLEKNGKKVPYFRAKSEEVRKGADHFPASRG